MSRYINRTCLFLCLLVCVLAPVSAQEYRATLLGVVSDPSGAVVVGAKVIVTNLDTTVESPTQSNADGNYMAAFLQPGRYSVRVEAPGFRTFNQSPLQLEVNARVRLDVKLEVGQSADAVTVTSEAPLLEMANASRGQVVTERDITSQPLNGHNPFSLMNIAAGVQLTGSLTFSRPFDQGAINGFSINGGRNGINEYQIDGVPNNSNTNSANIAYVPPVEATQEFKVQTNTYDAQFGRTGGGIISVSVKPGANLFHGAAYEYLRRGSLNANTFSNNANRTARSPQLVDQYGGMISGPVHLGKLYNGKNRTFFMFALEKYRENQPRSGRGRVPLASELQGDFSDYRNGSGKLYTIYDPLTVHLNPGYDPKKAISLSNPQYIRDAFANNAVPTNRFDPAALQFLKDLPSPTSDGEQYTHANNFFYGGASEPTRFGNWISRIDHNINDRWKMYGRWDYSKRSTLPWDPNNISPTSRAYRNGTFERRNDGAVVDLAGVLTPTTVVDFRVGYNRYLEQNYKPPVDACNTLAFVKSLCSQLQRPDRYPIVNVSDIISLGSNDNAINPSDTIDFQGNVMKNIGAHGLRFGFEYRISRLSYLTYDDTQGNYSFGRDLTSITPNTLDPNSGVGLASLLLGYMNSGSAMLQVATTHSWRYPVLFFQDDWQVNRRLTLNLGLRWDYEAPVVERFNKMNRGFDYNANSPVQVQAPAGVSGFASPQKGGLLFAGVNGQPRGAFDPNYRNFQPRLGAAFRPALSKALVIRGGFGKYYLPTTETGGNTGFSRRTSVNTMGADFMPLATLSNPFPNGLLQPLGSELGLSANLGDGVSFGDPSRRVPHVWQFSGGMEYQLRGGILLEASYSGSRTGDIQVGQSLDILNRSQIAQGTAALNTVVSNPYYGVLPKATSRGSSATTQLRNLIVPYPQFTSVSANQRPLGSQWYNSLQVKMQKRFSSGIQFLVSYTFSKTMESTGFKNAQDSELSRELVSYDVPNRLVVSGVYELPFGPGRSALNKGILAHLVGGWNLNWIFTYQSGRPMGLPDYYINGDIRLPEGQQTRTHWFKTNADDPKLWVQRPPDTYRNSQFRSSTLRLPNAPQLDGTITREFRISERQRLQFKLTAFNATNTPIYPGPNTTPTASQFGRIPDGQNNLPRNVEIGMRYSF